MTNILQSELRVLFEEMKEVTRLLGDTETEKVDVKAQVAIAQGFVKRYDIVWNLSDEGRRVNVTGKEAKENYKKMVMMKNKLKNEFYK
jgi:hypothetical protein